MFHKNYYKYTILALLLMVSSAGATTIIVPDNYASIQGAINAASNGDTIEVHSGTYYENVNVNKKLTLRGIGMPVVDAGGSGSSITLAADGIVLEGFTATGGGLPNAGIKVISNNNTLAGNNALNNKYSGIWLNFSSNNTIIGNNALNNKNNDIYLTSSNYNTLSGNNASNNHSIHIMLSNSSYNTLSGNNASNNDYGGIGFWLADSNYNTISGNNASNNIWGILLHFSNNNTISGNNANSNYRGSNGILLEYSSNNNTLIDNIALLDGHLNIFQDWSCSNNTNNGEQIPILPLPPIPPVPEASTIILVSAGLLGLMLFSRKLKGN